MGDPLYVKGKKQKERRGNRRRRKGDERSGGYKGGLHTLFGTDFPKMTTPRYVIAPTIQINILCLGVIFVYYSIRT